MNHSTTFWKFVSLLFILSTISLTYYAFFYKPSHGVGEMSLDDIDRDSYEENKKQNPIFSHDANDFFFKNQTSIRFLKDLYDFDTIQEGTILTKTIQFVNMGNEPYFITNVKVSCGCTVPTYEKEPVKPNDTGMVKIEFKSKGKDGFSMNKLSLFGNTKENENSVYFKLYVKK